MLLCGCSNPVPDLAATYTALLAGKHEDVLATPLPPEGTAERARLLAWRAQSLRALGRPRAGAMELIQAIRITKALGESQATEELRALHAELSRSVAALEAADKARLADASLVDTPADALDSDTLLRKAQAHADAGDDVSAIHVSRLALERAADARAKVLAHLALARFTREPGAVHAAHAVADHADDPNLVTAVAQAARALGVKLRGPSFG